MLRHTLLVAALALSTGITAGNLFAAAQQEPIFGSQLMTEQERIEHRNMMRNLNTEEEREAYRQQHHERMQARAQEMGITLPDEPPPRGRGMGRGMGPGPGGGLGPGRGMGPGGGPGPKQ